MNADFESLLEPEDVLLYAADAAKRRHASKIGVTERWRLHLSSALPFEEFNEHVRLNLLVCCRGAMPCYRTLQRTAAAPTATVATPHIVTHLPM